MLEDVGPLLGFHGNPSTYQYEEYRTILVEGSLCFKHALRGILQNDSDYDEVTKDGELNLELLWAKCKP